MLNRLLSFSQTGVRDWLFQRISAAIVGAYSVTWAVFLYRHPVLDYVGLHHFMGQVSMRVFSLMALLAVLVHAWIGLWVVATDYIQSTGVRLGYQILVLCLLFGYFLWGVLIFSGVSS